jgi:hypothetical protein
MKPSHEHLAAVELKLGNGPAVSRVLFQALLYCDHGKKKRPVIQSRNTIHCKTLSLNLIILSSVPVDH